ncbi:Zn-dependent exopeptidase, partial [Atractiella rhizophila]
MADLLNGLRHMLSFRRGPVTTLIVVSTILLLYFICAAQYIQPSSHLSQNPSDEPRYNLSRSYSDLQHITAHPRPYNSHANDDVKSYLITRIKEEIARCHWAELDVDDTKKAFQSSSISSGITYAESGNLLVRFNGSDGKAESTLFSAHYDSGAISRGASDDGMGVAAVLSLVSLFSSSRPKQTAILLFDNGEEAGLLGAILFLYHPWSKTVRNFLNLEGGGVGGHPNLFRISSSADKSMLKRFGEARRPHGSSLFSDAFELGLIRSGTNFDIWARPERWPLDVDWDEGKRKGWQGLDLAFYQRRDRYHTIGDNVPNLEGTASLESMLDDTWAVARTLFSSNTSQKNKNDEAPAKLVYFDLVLHRVWITFPLHVLRGLDITLLVLGPINVFPLIFFTRIRYALQTKRGWGRHIFAFFLVVGTTACVISLYVRVNPDIIFSRSLSTLFSITAASASLLWIFLQLFPRWRPTTNTRTKATLLTYLLFWMLDVANEALLAKKGVAAFYALSITHGVLLLSTIICLVELMARCPSPVQRRGTRGSLPSEPPPTDEDQADETTALLPTRQTENKRERGEEDVIVSTWWLEFIISFPFPFLLWTSSALTLLDALSPTVIEGGPVLGAYLIPSLFTIPPFLLLIPLAHRFSTRLTIFLLIFSVFVILVNTTAFPLSPSYQTRLGFAHEINLQENTSTITLSGIDDYLSRATEQIP